MTLLFISIFGIVASVLIYLFSTRKQSREDKITEVQKVADATGQTQRILWPDGNVRVVEPRFKTSEQDCIDNLQRIANETGKPTNYRTMDGVYHGVFPESKKKENTLDHLPFPATVQSDTYRRDESPIEDIIVGYAAASLLDNLFDSLFDSSSNNDSSPSVSSNDDFGGFGGGDFGGGGAEGSWSND